MVTQKLGIVFFSLVISLVSRSCYGDFLLQFSPDNSITNINTQQYDSFNIDLFIAQNGTETRLTDFGLLGFGVRATYDAGILTATGGSVSTSFPINGDPDLDISVPGQADMFGGSVTPPKLQTIYLGTIQFTANSTGLTVINFGDLDMSFDDFSLNDSPAFTGIDQDLFGPSLTRVFGITVNVTAVPEPSSIGLVLIPVMLISRYRFRQWKKTCPRQE